MTGTLLSIVVPTYNRRGELQTMLDSLLPQARNRPVEILIADDRSTDDTWPWLQATFAGDRQVRAFRMDANGGPGPARNLCLAAAHGEYFLPVDSDFIVMEGAIDRVLAVLAEGNPQRVFFFSCLQYPAMQRLDRMRGRREIDCEAFLTDDLGELIPVANLSWMRSRNLSYPLLRAGGETLLWAAILESGAGLFVDTPIVLYRTDVGERICTLEYQMKHPADLAAIADAMLDLYARRQSPALRAMQSRKCLAAGTYHLLAGNMKTGRQRLLAAATMGSKPALATLAASLAGKKLFGKLFRVYRTRVSRAYL